MVIVASSNKSWQRRLIDAVRSRLAGDGFWDGAFAAKPRMHLAILIEPYLTAIMTGTKTIESRFSMTRRSPYQCVKPGDIAILKRSAGPVVGVCMIDDPHFYELNPATLQSLRQKYSRPLAISDPNFWRRQSKMRYATLMHISHPTRLENVTCNKVDRRGWVSL